MGRGSGGGGRPPGSGKTYEGDASFADVGTAIARALYGGNIGVNKEQWDKLEPATRRFILAHEIVHHTIEDFILGDNDRWNQAEAALTIKETARGKLLVGGNTRMGESIADSIAAVVANDRLGNLSDAQWGRAKKWATSAVRGAGYSVPGLRRSVERLYSQLSP